MKIMVSACLLGQNCKYNGGNNFSERLAEFLSDKEVVPVCPEVMGGLPTPRIPCEIKDGVVVNKAGDVCDIEFRRGAELALKTAREENIDIAILQSRSPSCGIGQIYDGTFSRTLKEGNGIFAELLLRNGFRAIDVANLGD